MLLPSKTTRTPPTLSNSLSKFYWQKGLTAAAIAMLAGNAELTVMVTELEVAGFPLAQLLFDVSLHVTISPFAGIYE